MGCRRLRRRRVGRIVVAPRTATAAPAPLAPWRLAARCAVGLGNEQLARRVVALDEARPPLAELRPRPRSAAQRSMQEIVAGAQARMFQQSVGRACRRAARSAAAASRSRACRRRSGAGSPAFRSAVRARRPSPVQRRDAALAARLALLPASAPRATAAWRTGSPATPACRPRRARRCAPAPASRSARRSAARGSRRAAAAGRGAGPRRAAAACRPARARSCSSFSISSNRRAAGTLSTAARASA